MEQIWLVLASVAIFFGAIALRGFFGWVKNNKISDVKFDWKKFFGGAITPVTVTISVGALAGLILVFLKVVGYSGIQVAGLDQISVDALLVGIFIADIGALGYASAEALKLFGLSDKQIEQIRTTANTTKADETLGIAIKSEDGELVATAVNVKQDAGDSSESDDIDELAQMGAFPYYKVNVSSAQAFYDAVIGRGFDEGYGLQCVAGFKQHQYSQGGRIVATSNGGANGYANQRAQIEALGYTYYNDGKLQNGDWVIFGGGAYGHVAMYWNGKFLGQNQGASNPNVGNAFNLSSIGNPYLCHYRPNQLKVAPAPAPTPTPAPAPAPNGDVKVGSTVRPINAVGYNGASLASFVTQRDYEVIEVNGDRAVLGNGLNTAFRTGNLRVVAQPQAPAPAPQPAESATPAIGDKVGTHATTDVQNGLELNLGIINDGQSIFGSVNSKGNAVLVKNGVARCAVPVSSLYKL